MYRNLLHSNTYNVSWKLIALTTVVYISAFLTLSLKKILNKKIYDRTILKPKTINVILSVHITFVGFTFKSFEIQIKRPLLLFRIPFIPLPSECH